MNKNLFIVSIKMNIVVPVFILISFILVYAKVVHIGNEPLSDSSYTQEYSDNTK